MATDLDVLKNDVEKASKLLANVHVKRMFGCDGFFTDDSIFALIWKEGRIGVRLSDPDLFDKLMSIKGAQPWKAGKMVMSKWVLVPETFHGKIGVLEKWLTEAHALAASSVKAPKKQTQKKIKK